MKQKWEAPSTKMCLETLRLTIETSTLRSRLDFSSTSGTETTLPTFQWQSASSISGRVAKNRESV